MAPTFKPDRIITVLGDQLTDQIAALRSGNRGTDIVLISEVMDEASYVRHHKKKLTFIFSAMRHFADQLSRDGWNVRYVKLDGPQNTGSIVGELQRALTELNIKSVLHTEASEYRLSSEISQWASSSDIKFTTLPDDRFIFGREEFREWVGVRKQIRMEHFYRQVRRKTALLMDDEKPAGGKWNFDAENRSAASDDLSFPHPMQFVTDQITDEVLEMVEKLFPENIGQSRPFWFAVTRKDALSALDDFIKHALPHFGTYQDAMLEDEPFLFHSVLSQYLNVGLLQPLEICLRAEEAWRCGHAPINAAEGLIRQIIGWREFVRGIYWLKMPGYIESNFLETSRSLPDFYWTGDTEMACMRSTIEQTIEQSYAHHIQRLMVTGNFAMLAGVKPSEVHEWYLSVYSDAFEWVEAPNVIGMSQFADGGVLASKPYAASGNYINKMSNYCGNCRFNVKVKTGEDACPFNALYWNFLDRNSDKLNGNPRLGNTYRTWSKMSIEKQSSYNRSAENFLGKL